MEEIEMMETAKKEDVVLQEASNEAPASVVEENPVGSQLEVKADEEDAVAPAADAEEKEESPVRVGYTVGVREDGNFVFQITGEKPGLVEILGTHVYASKKIGLLYDRSQMEGQQAIAAQFGLLGQKFNKMIETLNKLMNQLAAAGVPVPEPSVETKASNTPNNKLR